jgi:hypothetical protein
MRAVPVNHSVFCHSNCASCWKCDCQFFSPSFFRKYYWYGSSVSCTWYRTCKDKVGLTILFVLISALFSFIFGPRCLEKLNIKSKIAKGLAMGACAQVLGVGKSFQWGEEAGALGSIGMTMSAVLVSFFIPILSMIW